MRSYLPHFAHYLAWFCVTACISAFWVITFLRPTRWYRDDTGDHFKAIWQKLQLHTSLLEQGKIITVVQGISNTQAS